MASYIHKIVIVKYILITKKEIIKRKRTREAVQRYRHSKSAVYYTANIFFIPFPLSIYFRFLKFTKKKLSVSVCLRV